MVKVVEGIHSIDLSEKGDHSLECWILDCPEGVILIDTGMVEGSFEIIENELKSIDKTWKDITKILITHKHRDHINNLYNIQVASQANVMAHKGDASEIEVATNVNVENLSDKQILDFCGGIEVVHIPGHTKGNSCFYLRKYNLMIAGDTIFRDQMDRLSPPPKRYCMDLQQATEGISRLLNYDFDKLLITHGRPELADAKDAVRGLVDTTTK